MMEKIMNLKGLSCPIPLLKTRDALKDTDIVKVIVDELPPKENIIKFAKSQNYQVECAENCGEYVITIRK